MKNHLVMRAVANEIDNLWKIINHPKNEGKPGLVAQYGRQVLDLADAYFELRGHSGIAWNIAGMDTEAQRVAKTRDTVSDMMGKEA